MATALTELFTLRDDIGNIGEAATCSRRIFGLLNTRFTVYVFPLAGCRIHARRLSSLMGEVLVERWGQCHELVVNTGPYRLSFPLWAAVRSWSLSRHIWRKPSRVIPAWS